MIAGDPDAPVRMCPVCQARMPARIDDWIIAVILEQGEHGFTFGVIAIVCSQECAEQGGTLRPPTTTPKGGQDAQNEA